MTASPLGDAAEIERLAAALARITRTTRRRTKLPLGASSISALAIVVDQGPTRLGDLAKIEGITPATLSRIIARDMRDGVRMSPIAARHSSRSLQQGDGC